MTWTKMTTQLGLVVLEGLLSQMGWRKLPPDPRDWSHLKGMEIAHRGQCSEAPENTLASIERAAHIGARAVEFDVGRTRDGHFVLMHDLTLDRTTTGTGRLSAHDNQDLRTLRIKADQSLGIPQLEEALQMVVDLGLYADVEVKEDVDPIAFAALLHQLDQDLNLRERIWVSSFYPQHLYMIRKQLPWLSIAYNLAPKPTRNPLLNLVLHSHWLLDFLGASIVKPYKTLLVDARVEAWQATGRQVMVWTVNTRQEKQNAHKLGAALITDCVGGYCEPRDL